MIFSPNRPLQYCDNYIQRIKLPKWNPPKTPYPPPFSSQHILLKWSAYSLEDKLIVIGSRNIFYFAF